MCHSEVTQENPVNEMQQAAPESSMSKNIAMTMSLLEGRWLTDDTIHTLTTLTLSWRRVHLYF